MTMEMLLWQQIRRERIERPPELFGREVRCAVLGRSLQHGCGKRTANPNDADVALLDQPGAKDPPGSVYRNQWAAAPAFGGAAHFMIWTTKSTYGAEPIAMSIRHGRHTTKCVTRSSAKRAISDAGTLRR